MTDTLGLDQSTKSDYPTANPASLLGSTDSLQGLEKAAPAVDRDARVQLFQSHYEKFISQRTEESALQSIPSEAAVPKAVVPENLDSFVAQYEKFVGCSISDQFSRSERAGNYRYDPSRYHLNPGSVLKSGLLGVGSLVATLVVGSLLINSTRSDTNYTYRDYSPAFLTDLNAPITPIDSATSALPSDIPSPMLEFSESNKPRLQLQSNTRLETAQMETSWLNNAAPLTQEPEASPEAIDESVSESEASAPLDTSEIFPEIFSPQSNADLEQNSGDLQFSIDSAIAFNGYGITSPETSVEYSKSQLDSQSTTSLSHLVERFQSEQKTTLTWLPLTPSAAQEVVEADGEQFANFQVVRLTNSDYLTAWSQTVTEANSEVTAPVHGFIDYERQLIVMPTASDS